MCCGYVDELNIKYKRNGCDIVEIFVYYVVLEFVLFIFFFIVVMLLIIFLMFVMLKVFFDEVVFFIGEDNVLWDYLSGVLIGVVIFLVRWYFLYW